MQTTMQPVVVANNPVIVSPQTGDLSVDPTYHAKQSFVLGIIELVAGVLCIISNSVAIEDYTTYYVYKSYYGAGPGIWCGFFYIVAGILSLVSGQNKKKLLINASLAMNIVSSIFGFCLFIWARFGVTYDAIWGNSVQLGMGWMLLILSFLVCVVSIWLYVIGCMSCCRARRYTTTTVITTAPAGTVINPGATSLHNLPTTQVIHATGQANVAYAYQPPVANQQMVNVQPQLIQTPGYPQQQVIQTAAYPQPQPMMQPGVNPHQAQMAQPPPYPHQPPVYHQPPAPSAGSYGKSDAIDGGYEVLQK